MNATFRRTRASLLIVLIGGTVGWLLFTAGTYFDMVLRNGYTSDELYGSDPVGLVFPSKYLTLAAIASLAICALIAKRRLLSDSESHGTDRFHASVLMFTNVAMIVSLAFSAIAGISVFMSGFLNGFQATAPLPRLLDVYLPIILHTALLVSVILAGFVFLRHPTLPQHLAATPPLSETIEADQTGVSRALGLAYAVPIIAAAIALILGLIVYDMTRSAPEVWIWVIIVAIVAAGIVVGTRLSRGAADAASVNVAHASGVTAGAINLNLVLSIVFSVFVAGMALGYGTAATSALQSNTYASLYIYDDEWGVIETNADPQPLAELTLQADGSGLDRRSDATITITPGDFVAAENTVDSSGYVWIESTEIPALDAGDYTVTFAFTNAKSESQTLVIKLSVDDEGLASFPNGAQTSFDTSQSELLPLSFSWFMNDLLPAFLLWVLTMIVIYLTLSMRNRGGALTL